jgi:uncharacterized protein (DUF58 family)
MRNDPEVLQAASLYTLGLPRMPVSGQSGELLGRGTGTSLEFQEHREYMPGDDIRHLDWAAYARSDSLMVRLYREEISPRMEVIVDISRSMSTSVAKQQVAKQITALVGQLSGALGGRPTIWLAGDERPPQTLQMETLDRLETLEFNAVSTFDALLDEHQLPLKRQAVRIVISDFLFQHDPENLVRRLAGEASVLWLVQVLTEWENNPSTKGGTRLIDIESGQETDLYLNSVVVGEYLTRLSRLKEELALHCRRHHSTFVSVVAERGLSMICREDWSQAGILRPSTM